MDKDLKNKTEDELGRMAEAMGEKRFHGRYLFSFIQSQGITDIQAVTPLSKRFRERLIQDGFAISALNMIERLQDPDGTIKYLFGTPDDLRIESVLLKDGDRHTLCISSQSGCRMGCRFCATARIGLRGHLSAAPIVDQVNHVIHEGNDIHNIVYMGMGEPLDNLDAVLRSIRILKNKHGRNLGQRHITVSTCGLPEGMIRLAQEEPQVRLAVSLHAPDDELRTRLMPINRRYSVSDILKAVRQCQAITGRRVTFEYCLMRGVNDQVTQAQALVAKLRGIKAHVNLIQFNEFPGCVFKDSDRTTGHRFAQVLQEAGIEIVIRYTRGRRIKAACGQLGATWSPAAGVPTRAQRV